MQPGCREDGDPWTVQLRGSHTLIAGATGAGKESVLWSLIRGLGPAIRDGLVRLWVVDPKGGLEVAAGRPLFDQFAMRPPATWPRCLRMRWTSCRPGPGVAQLGRSIGH